MTPLKLPALKLPVLPKSAWTVAWLSLAISLATIIVLTILPKKAPLVVFDIVAESLVQEISRPALSAFFIEGAMIDDRTGCDASFFDGDLFTGVVHPPAGSLVAYNWRATALAVGIDRQGVSAPVRLTSRSEAECELTAGSISLRVNQAAGGLLLPLAGAAEIGRELGVATTSHSTGLLRSGSFQVFGRSIAPWAADVLYPITTGPVVLPAGSRLSVEGPGDTARALFGLATHTPEGFVISATADASLISLYRPGADDQRERFAFGVFSDFFGDPQIGVIFFFVFLVVTVLQVVTGWVGLWRDSQPGSGK